MPDKHDFLPIAGRSAQLDGDRHADLAASLQHIRDVVIDVAPEISTCLGPVVVDLEAGRRLPPLAFGAYFELVDAIASDNLVYASDCARTLAAVKPRPPGMRVYARGSEEYQAMDRMLDLRIGPEASKFAPVDPERASEMSQRIKDGLALLRAGLPDLADEIEGLVHEVCVAQAPEGSVLKFDGASHYQFWGLLLLNPNYHQDRLAMAEVLAHEAGHSFLFGLTDHEALVLNPDTELYPSPLRRDPRPMDGIYHATFVSARMAYAMETLAESGVLSSDERVKALDAAAQDRANFASGHSVIAEHGQLSPTGKRIMDAAVEWIGQTPPPK